MTRRTDSRFLTQLMSYTSSDSPLRPLSESVDFILPKPFSSFVHTVFFFMSTGGKGDPRRRRSGLIRKRSTQSPSGGMEAVAFLRSIGAAASSLSLRSVGAAASSLEGLHLVAETTPLEALDDF